MEHDQVENDLAFIRRTMESSLRYTSIPALGYMVAGILGLSGVWLTLHLLVRFSFLVDRPSIFTIDIGILNLSGLRGSEVLQLTGLWLGIFIMAALGSAILITIRSRRQNISAWNSLAARMYVSQLPLVFVAGVLTLGLGRARLYQMIPALWLLSFGVILISFSYFTSVQQRVEGLIFILLGTAAVLLHGGAYLICLGLGFGGILLISGVIRYLRDGSFL